MRQLPTELPTLLSNVVLQGRNCSPNSLPLCHRFSTLCFLPVSAINNSKCLGALNWPSTVTRAPVVDRSRITQFIAQKPPLKTMEPRFRTRCRCAIRRFSARNHHRVWRARTNFQRICRRRRLLSAHAGRLNAVRTFHCRDMCHASVSSQRRNGIGTAITV